MAACSPSTAKSNYTEKNYPFKHFLILEYHLIGRPEARWCRTPENFKRDLQWLYDNGFYPMNLKDILTGFEGLPAGKIPVILTFDDSSSSQFRYLPNGEIDPECGIGVMKAFHDENSKDWPLRGTFFVLISTNNPDRNLFGQTDIPGYPEKKIKQLVDWGIEIGSHTYSHNRLSDINEKTSRYVLARSSYELEKMTGQKIVSLATPMGLYPPDDAIFSGKYQKINYDYKLVCKVGGGPQVVPSSPDFRPLHLNRTQAIESEWDMIKRFF